MEGSKRRADGLSPLFLATAVIVALAVLSVAWSLNRGILRSDRAVAEPELEVGVAERTIDVRVTGFGNPTGMSILSLSASGPPQSVDRLGLAEGLEVPEARAFLIAAERATGELAGFALVTPSDPGRDLRNPADAGGVWTIDPVTTARSLVALAPGVLDRDPALTTLRVNNVADTPEFDALVAEIIGTPDLRAATERLEQALAAVLDRVPGEGVLADPRCDSVAGSVSVPATGGCVFVLRGSTTVEISNGQPRWIAVFSNGESAACALVPPRPAAITFDLAEQCDVTIELAAPGLLPDGSGPALERQVALATALDAFSSYALPFADLALGGSGAASNAALLAIADEPVGVTSAFGALLDANAVATESAATLADITQQPHQRSAALLTVSRFALADAAITDQLIARTTTYEPNDVGASLLAMYDRAKVHREGGAAPPVWTANAWEQIDLQPLVDRAGE